MFNVFKNIFGDKASKPSDSEYLAAPLSGKVVPITEVPDPVFSEKMMGDGFAIMPTSGEIVSPVDGVVDSIFPTKHAIGLKSRNNHDIIIHFGLETVNLNGEGFEVFVEAGQKVTAGQKLLEVDIEEVRKKVPIITSVVVSNLTEGESISIEKMTDVTIGEKAVAVIKHS